MNQADLDAMFARDFAPSAPEPPVVNPVEPVIPPVDVAPVVEPVVATPPVDAPPIAEPIVAEPIAAGGDDDPVFAPVGIFDLLGDPTPSATPQATQEPVTPTPTPAQPQGIDPEILALLKNKLGVDATDLATAKQALEQYKTPTIAGYDAAVSAAILKGDITLEELAANKVHDFSVLTNDEAATYHLTELAGLTFEEAQQHVEGLDEAQKKIYAAQFRREQERSREAILQQARAQKDQRMIEQETKRNEFKSEVIAASRSVSPETININGYKPAQAETTQVARFMEAIAIDPQKALSLVLGKTPDDLARNLTILLYPEKMQEEAFKRGKNKAISSTIREAQNPNVAARTGIPPTATPTSRFGWSTDDLIKHRQ